MAATLEKLKAYLRIDSDYEDELLNDFLNDAKAYLQGAIANFDENYQHEEFATKADRVQVIIAAELYQNRDSRNDSRNDYSYTVRSMLNQLRYFAPPKVVIVDEDSGEPDSTDLDGRLDGETEDNLSDNATQ